MLGGSFSLSAQISRGGEPLGAAHPPERAPFPYLEMPELNEEVLLRADSIRARKGETPLRFAENHKVRIDAKEKGEWRKLEKGGWVWRVGVRSSGAHSLGFGFHPVAFPEGGRLFIYTPDMSEVRGGFDQRNVTPDSVLATAPLPGDRAVIELFVPEGERDELQFRIERVSHAYRNIFHSGLSKLVSGYGDAGDCNMNVNCPDGEPYQDPKRAVGMIVDNGNRLCSGTLVNNTAEDAAPYFLTAKHCMDGGGPPSGWVVVFNYESPCCQEEDGATDHSISGATLRADNEDSDFALLELNDTPPDEYEVFYAGWDHSGNTPDSTVSIHHPQGDVKKISFDDDPPASGQYGNSIPNGEWHVKEWDRNTTTEVGSSGGPLFNSEGKLIGQLHGGQADCSNSVNDYFGKFSVSWNENPNSSDRLADWLDLSGSGVNPLDGMDPLLGKHAVNAAITDVPRPCSSVCGDEGLEIEAVLLNRGSDKLDNAELYVLLGGDTLEVRSWSGSLQTGEEELLQLGPYSPSNEGSHPLTVGVRKPNGTSDEDSWDDETTKKVVLVKDGENYSIDLRTDCYGSETYWDLLSEDDDTLYSRSEGYYPGSSGDPVEGGHEVLEEVCLSKGSCYSLELWDAYGDGMLGSQYGGCDVDGALRIEDPEGMLLAKLEDPDFGDHTVLEFCTDSVIEEEEEERERRIALFPNPASSWFDVTVQGEPGDYSLELFDLRGKRVLRTDFKVEGQLEHVGFGKSPEHLGQGRKRVDVRHLRAGVYVLALDGPGPEFRQKLILHR